MRNRPVIRGAVNLWRRPAIDVELIGAEGERQTIEAQIDTGFTGDLTLSSFAIEQLGFPFVAVTSFRTGEGSLVEFETYEGAVLWNGHQLVVNVLESEVFPLIGVGLLWGNNLSVDFRHGGSVTITEIEEDQA